MKLITENYYQNISISGVAAPNKSIFFIFKVDKLKIATLILLENGGT